MDPNVNPQEYPPSESFDNYNAFSSNPSGGQDSTVRFRGQGHYQGPYPTSNPRMRYHGEFQQRGRYSYHKRGGNYRGQNQQKNFDQFQEQSNDNNEHSTTTTNFSNRNFNKYFRPTMLEDPWAHLKPQKIPSNGTTLVFDSTNQ